MGTATATATPSSPRFFTFYDFADSLAEGTDVTVENLVPTGLHGHGWEPDPSIQRRITDADALVHVGPDFQPWVDRAIDARGRVDRDGAYQRPSGRRPHRSRRLADGRRGGRGAKDPHFWLDPQRAKIAVENIADGLAAVDPDHEATIRENATALKAELDALDDEWQAVFDAAERDVAFLAAHNAFAYVSHRYDATIEPLVVNLAASNDVRPADMQRAQETIADHGIEHIGAAVFEPIRPAQTAAGADRCRGVLPRDAIRGHRRVMGRARVGVLRDRPRGEPPDVPDPSRRRRPEDVTFADYGRNFQP